MKLKPWIFVSVAATLAALCTQAVADDGSDFREVEGAVYTMSNATSGNQILIFNRTANGRLTAAGEVATNGLGAGGSLDALGSQGSLAQSDDQRWLLAANAGSNEISVMRIDSNHLEFHSKVSSGGTFPVSVAVFRDLVYILNGGSAPNVAANLAGFRLSFDGRLTPLPNSTRTLPSSAYAQVGFDQWGHNLLVTDKGGSKILAFAVSSEGLPAASPAINTSSGAAPFGFGFDQRDHLLTVEAGANAVSSYTIEPGDGLKAISASVANGQKASCWIATNGSRFLFTANPGSSTLSSFKLDTATGSVSLLAASAGMVGKPLDIATTRNGHYLYALDAGNLQIDAFEVGRDGKLTSLGPVNGGFAIYAQGLVVH